MNMSMDMDMGMDMELEVQRLVGKAFANLEAVTVLLSGISEKYVKTDDLEAASRLVEEVKMALQQKEYKGAQSKLEELRERLLAMRSQIHGVLEEFRQRMPAGEDEGLVFSEEDDEKTGR